MHHKRGRPKNARAGCLMCKPWKMNGAKDAMKKVDRDWRPTEDKPVKAKSKFVRPRPYGIKVTWVTSRFLLEHGLETASTTHRFQWYQTRHGRENALRHLERENATSPIYAGRTCERVSRRPLMQIF